MFRSVPYDLVKTRLLESEAEAEELNQSQSVGTRTVIGLSFRFCFRFRQSGFHQPCPLASMHYRVTEEGLEPSTTARGTTGNEAGFSLDRKRRNC